MSSWSSHQEVSVKKVFLECNFIKKETLAQVFSCEFCEISKNIFSHRTPPVAASVITRSVLKKLNVHNNNLYVRFLKTMWYVFYNVF